MFRIRFHGRGGQGMKTAGRILGSAFFLEGFEVQDAPRYGAERRGAPIFSYVRADPNPILERGIIQTPDLIIVADETLIPIPAAGVLQGITANTVLLIISNITATDWKARLNYPGEVITLRRPDSEENKELAWISSYCAGAAARLTGVISDSILTQAVETELPEVNREVLEKNIAIALKGFSETEVYEHSVIEEGSTDFHPHANVDWIDLPLEKVGIAAPAIHNTTTSEQVKTGLWRTERPVIDYERCKHCWWICSTFCPDSAILVDEQGVPRIDYDHCKGCMICVAQCPAQANLPIPETEIKSEM